MWVVALSSGLLGDWLLRTDRMSVAAVRKIFTGISHGLPAAGVIGAAYAGLKSHSITNVISHVFTITFYKSPGCDRATVIALFTLSMAVMGTFYPGMRVNAMDLSPNYAGTIMAFVNGFGATSGFIAPYLIGYMTMNVRSP